MAINSGPAWIELVGSALLIYGFLVSGQKKGLWLVLLMVGITGFLGVLLQNVFSAREMCCSVQGWGILLAFNEINWALNSIGAVLYSLLKLETVIPNPKIKQLVRISVGLSMLGYTIFRIYIGVLRAMYNTPMNTQIEQAHSGAFAFWGIADLIIFGLLIYNVVRHLMDHANYQISKAISTTMLFSSFPRFFVIVFNTFFLIILSQLTSYNPTNATYQDLMNLGWMIKGTYPLILLFDIHTTKEMLVNTYRSAVTDASDAPTYSVSYKSRSIAEP